MRQDSGRTWLQAIERRLLGRPDGGGQVPVAALDAAREAVIGVDAQGRVMFLNDAAQRLLQWSAEDAVGRAAELLVPDLPQAVQQVRQRLAAGLAVGAVGEGARMRAIAHDGTAIPVTAWLTPVAGHRGLPVAVTLHDERPEREIASAHEREVRAQRATTEAVLAAVRSQMIVLADAEGTITRCNRAAERVLGYRSDELAGQPTTALSDPGDLESAARELGVADGLDPLLELARCGLPNRQDWDYLTRSGQRRPVSLVVTAVRDEEQVVGFVCAASDRSLDWQPLTPVQASGDRLLRDLDDAATRVLRWGVGSSRTGTRASAWDARRGA